MFENEMEFRHPGTSWESDDEDERHPMAKEYTPITTKAGQYLHTVAFAGPEGTSCEMHGAYPMQITIRVDDKRQCINYDLCEFKKRSVDTDNDVPTNRELKMYEAVMDFNQSSPRSAWDSDDSSDEGDEYDSFLDKLAEPKEGTEFSNEVRQGLNIQALAGGFMNSRVFRFRVSLKGDNVVGVRLQTMRAIGTEEGEEDISAVLVFEVSKPPTKMDFCARKVCSNFLGENRFVEVEDWTPNTVASKATRHYIFGSLKELKELAAHLATICPNVRELMKKNSTVHNTLLPPASLSYSAAPAFSVEDEDDGEGKKRAKKNGVMTKDEVVNLLASKGFFTENACFSRAVLCGHIKIDDKTTKETVIFRGSCLCCEEPAVCTIRDALNQSTYGSDYEDGGEGGAVQCEGEECSGMYITDLCTGNLSLDCGKFHNHCCECPDFGVCMGDYRSAHCGDCGNHYFRGMSGFPCPSCGSSGRGGGRKSKPLNELPPPPLSTWNGVIEGTHEKAPATMRRLMAATGTSTADDALNACPVS